MYYSAGTYEAFARPEKPEGADRKSAYIIGTGLAGLSAAFYLGNSFLRNFNSENFIRHVHIFNTFFKVTLYLIFVS